MAILPQVLPARGNVLPNAGTCGKMASWLPRGDAGEVAILLRRSQSGGAKQSDSILAELVTDICLHRLLPSLGASSLIGAVDILTLTVKVPMVTTVVTAAVIAVAYIGGPYTSESSSESEAASVHHGPVHELDAHSQRPSEQDPVTVAVIEMLQSAFESQKAMPETAVSGLSSSM
ncbi:hypothetical protein PHYPSEUDO_009432 [Phytophthora pseudosyringae]|uniref:Uncharacterized protein n=1 Tax=Phytophthora pseudosyringae TaxID=221518 RepID=A0A8T1VC79_9STRA|nr:hypothetical protein PHYPSEUDO_009432 [Phytophthora pseudosyringae]